MLRKALPVISTVASFVPGIGTAVSVGLSALNAAVQIRDAQVAKKRAEGEYKAQAEAYQKQVDEQKTKVAQARSDVNQIMAQAIASGDPEYIQFAQMQSNQVAEAEAQLGMVAQQAQIANAQAQQAGQEAAQLQAQYEAAKYAAKVTQSGALADQQNITPDMMQQQLVLDVLKSQGVDPNTDEAKAFARDYIASMQANQANQPAQPMSGYFQTSTPNWLIPAVGIGALLVLTSRRKRR